MKTRWNSPPSLDVGDKATITARYELTSEGVSIDVRDDAWGTSVLAMWLDLAAARSLAEALAAALDVAASADPSWNEPPFGVWGVGA